MSRHFKKIGVKARCKSLVICVYRAPLLTRLYSLRPGARHAARGLSVLRAGVSCPWPSFSVSFVLTVVTRGTDSSPCVPFCWPLLDTHPDSPNRPLYRPCGRSAESWRPGRSLTPLGALVISLEKP